MSSVSQPAYSVFVALPHYGSLEPSMLPGLLHATQSHRMLLNTNCCSLLAHNFNKLWAAALMQREALSLTHFAMIHSDVEAPAGWLDVLLDEMAAVGADVLGVPMALKDGRGLTSVGRQHSKTHAISRFTVKELGRLPETFCIDDLGLPEHHLLINTGLWLCRFTEAWVESFHFEVRDAIVELEDGRFQARVLPEDWNASGYFARKGLRVYLTRKLHCTHHGRAGFPNHGDWGDYETDPGDPF